MGLWSFRPTAIGHVSEAASWQAVSVGQDDDDEEVTAVVDVRSSTNKHGISMIVNDPRGL